MFREIEIPYCGIFRPENDRDFKFALNTRKFIQQNDDAFSRSKRAGHITASSFILDETGEHVLLTHHAKLGCWLQLGGHCDGVRDAQFVALKEAREESGLSSVRLLSSGIFDVDVHDIPANSEMPKHKHFDVRFLMTADRGEVLRPTSESKELRWVPRRCLARFTDKLSVLILNQKLVAS
ncbi:NUDIX domain-containing protein [Roseibium hamelinense]|nr:NUDIX domain-containing protein [Roseibium hamelinense]